MRVVAVLCGATPRQEAPRYVKVLENASRVRLGRPTRSGFCRFDAEADPQRMTRAIWPTTSTAALIRPGELLRRAGGWQGTVKHSENVMLSRVNRRYSSRRHPSRTSDCAP